MTTISSLAFDFLPFRSRNKSLTKDGRVSKDQLLTYLKSHMKAKSASRERLVILAEKQYCGDMFRFLGAIFDYELEAQTEGTTTFMNRFEAHRVMSLYVETDSPFEVSLSPALKNTLLEKKRNFEEADASFFDAAKSELASNILFNAPLLKSLYH